MKPAIMSRKIKSILGPDIFDDLARLPVRRALSNKTSTRCAMALAKLMIDVVIKFRMEQAEWDVIIRDTAKLVKFPDQVPNWPTHREVVLAALALFPIINSIALAKNLHTKYKF